MLSEPRCRSAKLAGIKSKIGYKRRPGSYGRKPSVVVDYTLDRQFDLGAPNRMSTAEQKSAIGRRKSRPLGAVSGDVGRA